LIRLVDELHDSARISDALWGALAAAFSKEQTVEFIRARWVLPFSFFFANGLNWHRNHLPRNSTYNLSIAAERREPVGCLSMLTNTDEPQARMIAAPLFCGVHGACDRSSSRLLAKS